MREPDPEYEAGLVALIDKELTNISKALVANERIQLIIEETQDKIEDLQSIVRALERDAREQRIHAGCCSDRIAEAQIKLEYYRDYIGGD